MRKAFIGAVAIVGMVGGWCLSASAATSKTRTRKFIEIAVGARISTTGNRYEDTYRIKHSPDRGGAAIQDATLDGSTFPVTGHDTMITFFRDGTRTTKDTFTLGPPLTNGIGRITGSGNCTGGTGVHKTEKCAYTFRGTYDFVTTVTAIRLTGTDTRVVAAATPGAHS